MIVRNQKEVYINRVYVRYTGLTIYKRGRCHDFTLYCDAVWLRSSHTELMMFNFTCLRVLSQVHCDLGYNSAFLPHLRRQETTSKPGLLVALYSDIMSPARSSSDLARLLRGSSECPLYDTVDHSLVTESPPPPWLYVVCGLYLESTSELSRRPSYGKPRPLTSVLDEPSQHA